MTESVALLSREKDEFLLGTVDFKEVRLGTTFEVKLLFRDTIKP